MSIVQSIPPDLKKSVRKQNLRRPDSFHISVIAEDLRAPLDEGVKKAYFNIIRSLIKKGVGVSVFTRYHNPLLEDACPLPANKLLFGEQFRRNLQAQSPDAILYMPSGSGTIGAFIRAAVIKKQSARIPLAMLHLQYRDLPAAGRIVGLYQSVDTVFTQSQASTAVLQSFGCKTVLLPGGVDESIFRPVDEKEKRLLRSIYGYQAAEKIVLHVGHLKRNRNVGALARLVEAGFRVILVTSTSTQRDIELKVFLEQSGMTVITDYVENIQHFYQMADCYVFPVFQALSAIDAPLSIMEAMACDIPVVTAPFGALPNMFQPGNGLYFIHTEEEMISTVKQAVQEPGCKTLKMIAPYSWESAASTILETLQGGNR